MTSEVLIQATTADADSSVRSPFDLSRVEHLEPRKLVHDHYYGEPEHDLPEERAVTAAIRAKIEAVRDTIRLKQREMEKEFLEPILAELEAIEKPYRDFEQGRWEQLESKLKEHGLEFDDFQLHDDYLGVYCCDVSGIALMNDDDLGETPSGEKFLFCLLPRMTGGEVNFSDDSGSDPANLNQP